MTVEMDMVVLLIAKLNRKLAVARVRKLNSVIFNLNCFADGIPLTERIAVQFASAIERDGHNLVRGGYKDLIWTVSVDKSNLRSANSEAGSQNSRRVYQ